MREIKFRAWNKETKFMCDESSVPSALYVLNNRLHEPYGDGFVLMQYTGIKRGGKEIYEGDIIKYCDYDTDINHRNKSGYDDEDNGVGVVEWADTFGKPGFQIEVMLPHKNRHQYRALDMAKMEVIGNIYENRELLK